MVAKGAAKWCSGNGYPSRYLTSAGLGSVLSVDALGELAHQQRGVRIGLESEGGDSST